MTATRPADFIHEGITAVNGESITAVNGLPVHDAQRLTLDGNQALIVLNDQVYNLRITRAGKLILTK